MARTYAELMGFMRTSPHVQPLSPGDPEGAGLVAGPVLRDQDCRSLAVIWGVVAVSRELPSALRATSPGFAGGRRHRVERAPSVSRPRPSTDGASRLLRMRS